MEVIIGYRYVLSDQSKISSLRCDICFIPIKHSTYDGFQVAVGRKGKKNHTKNCNPYFCIKCILLGKSNKIKISEEQIQSFVNQLKVFSKPTELTIS